MSQIEMFTRARARRVPQKTLRARVLDALHQRPQTDEELCRTLRRPANSVRPRRIELEHAGAIVCVGTRKSTRGRDAKIWAPVQEATTRDG